MVAFQIWLWSCCKGLVRCCLACGPWVRELWVLWRTPDPTCRLPSGFSLLQWYLSPSVQAPCAEQCPDAAGRVCAVLGGVTSQRGLFPIAVIFPLLRPWELTAKRWALLMGSNVAVLGCGWIAVFYWKKDFSLSFKAFLAASYLGKRKLTSTLFTNKNKLYKLRLFQSFMLLPVIPLCKTFGSSLNKNQQKIWTISSLSKQIISKWYNWLFLLFVFFLFLVRV